MEVFTFGSMYKDHIIERFTGGKLVENAKTKLTLRKRYKEVIDELLLQ